MRLRLPNTWMILKNEPIMSLFNRKNNDEEKIFAVAAQGILYGRELTLTEAQRLSDALLKDCGEKIVILINQNYIDLNAIIQPKE